MSITKYRVVLHSLAVKEIQALPKRIHERVKDIISDLTDNPIPHGAVRLQGRASAYRIRVSDYRILYEVHATEVVVYVIGVAHRREVYLRLMRRTVGKARH